MRVTPARLGGAIALVEIEDRDGTRGQGSAFHVGGGIFATARHVVEGKTVKSLGITYRVPRTATSLSQPMFHPDANVDVALIATELDVQHIAIGMNSLQMALEPEKYLLREVLVMGYPRIHFARTTPLVCTRAEINAITEPLNVGRSHAIISAMARGGFSGGPAVLLDTGTCLGIVTSSLVEADTATELGYFAVLDARAVVECAHHHGRELPGHPLPKGPQLSSHLGLKGE